MDSSVSKISCQSFRANLWRPHTCSNCYKSKSLHQLQSTESTHPKSRFKKLTSSPKPKKKDLRQVASIATLNKDSVKRGEWEGMPQRTHKTEPMIGVVKPYAVVDIDEDSETEEESNLDSVMKRRYTEPGNQVNKQHIRKSSSPVVPTASSLGVVKTKAMSASNQSLDKVSVTGEANVLETSPKPSRVIGKLLNEYHRSMSVTAIDKPPESGCEVERPAHSKRGKSVEPLDSQKTSVSVKRSSSLRQEVPKSSKLMSLLMRRKANAPTAEIKPLNPRLKTQHPKTPLSSVTIFASQPKVTSPHPVRRNKATAVYPHSLLVSKIFKNNHSRPKDLSLSSTSQKKRNTPTPQDSNTCAEVEPIKQKRTPPPKPPRTLSTFFTSKEQEELFKSLLTSGDIPDVAVRSRMTNELQTMDVVADRMVPRPPRRLRPGDYDEVVLHPQDKADSQSECVSRLPLGHSGDYAEVLSSSVCTSDSGSTDPSTDPDPITMETKPLPPTPPPRLHFVLPTTSTHSLTSSQDSLSTQLHSSTDSQELPPTPTQSQVHTSTQSQVHTSTQSQVHTSTQSRVHTSTCTPSQPSTQDSAYYSVPCTSKPDSPTGQTKPLSPSPSPPPTFPGEVIPYSSLYSKEGATTGRGERLALSLSALDLHPLLSATLDSVLERETERLVTNEDLWKINWEEMKIVSEREAVYKGKTLSIKGVETISPELQNSITVSKFLAPHLHLNLVRSIMTPPTHSTTLTPSPYYLLTDRTGTDTTSFFLSQHHTLTPDAYTDLILLTLLQVFSALRHLYTNGICHRDVGIESVYGYNVGGHWLVKLGDFNYALQRPGPVNATTFVYGYHELKWLGGVDSRLPPEVIDTPENAQTINYSHTDVFATGCMVYELCGQGNPFETNPELVFQNYTTQDLPSLQLDTILTPHLQRLTEMLVNCDTAKRISSSTALLVCQALKWLPKEWLESVPPEGLVRRHLCVEKGQLVCELARSEERGMSLETLLKAQFLSSCDVSELIRALSVFAVN